MKKLLAVLTLVAVSAPAWAQTGAQTPSQQVQTAQAEGQKTLYTCWYSASGNFTGTSSAPANEPVHLLQITGRGGDRAWAYAIHSVDGHDCPTSLPN